MFAYLKRKGNKMVLNPLVHQKQPTGNTCMSACLAMILDRPVQNVIDEFHDSFESFEMTIGDALHLNGVPFIAGRGANQNITIYHDYVYVLVAPSLTSPGILHQILLDTRDGKLVVYDPLKGTGKPYYTLDESDESEQAIKLVSWLVDYQVDVFNLGGYDK